MDQAISQTAAPVLRYEGRLAELYRIFLINLALMIVTLGIWRFWGKTRFRRYIWSHTSFQDERLEYTGRGSELFIGWLLVFGVLLGLIGLLFLAFWLTSDPVVAAIGTFVLYLVIIIGGLAAPFAAQRYRLSRTNWCGIRGGMTGSAFGFGLRAFGYVLLTVVTFYQFAPWAQVRLSRRLIDSSSFGTLRARCEARGGRLYLVFLATLIVSIAITAVVVLTIYALTAPIWDAAFAKDVDPVMQQVIIAQARPYIIVGAVVLSLLGNLAASFYLAAATREIIGHSTLGPLQFGSAVTGPKLLWLHLGNILLLTVTLGFGYPIVLQRNVRFTTANTLAAGRVDPAELGQSTLRRPGMGEGLLSQFDGAGAF